MTTLTLEDKLILLIEECGEVIQAATKCLRFGFTHHEPGYGNNDEALASEIGDVLGVIDSLTHDGVLDRDSVLFGRNQKMAKAESVARRVAYDRETLRLRSETIGRSP